MEDVIMSVITSHQVVAPDIVKRLSDKGCLIHTTLEDKNVNGGQGPLKDCYLLDYHKCSPNEASQYPGKDMSEIKSLQDVYASKRYVRMFPSEDGNSVKWMRNYGRNDLPSYMIAEQFPDEVMKYRVSTEQSFDGSCYFTNKYQACTADGKRIDASLDVVKKSQVKDMGDGTTRVSIPLEYSDKRLAQLYVPSDYVIPYDIMNPDTCNKMAIGVADKDASLEVYRRDKDGKTIKQELTYTEYQDMRKKCHDEYKNSLKTKLTGVKSDQITDAEHGNKRVSIQYDRQDASDAYFFVKPDQISQEADDSFTIDMCKSNVTLYRTTDQGKMKDTVSVDKMIRRVELANKPRTYTPSVAQSDLGKDDYVPEN